MSILGSGIVPHIVTKNTQHRFACTRSSYWIGEMDQGRAELLLTSNLWEDNYNPSKYIPSKLISEFIYVNRYFIY